MAANSGGQQPEQTTFLGFPARPEGDGGAVQAGRHCWYELAGEIQGAFADIERAIGGMRWSGDARHAFDAVWSQFSDHATEASQHSHEMGDTLFRIGGQIEDAQHQWDLAMAAMAASTAIGIGLTFLTCGISDDIALGAADAAVGTMTAACTALDISIDAAVQLLIAAVEVAVQLAVKFTWQFTIAVVSQEGANVVQGRSLGNVDLLQAAEFAGVSTLIPGLGKVTIGGRQVLAGVPGAIVTGAATDAAVQGLEGVTEGKPFSVGEVLLSAALAGAGQKLGAGLEARLAAEDGDPAQVVRLRRLCPDSAQLDRLLTKVENPSTLEKYLGRLSPDELERTIGDTAGRGVPQGVTSEQFTQLSAKVRAAASQYGGDIRIQGSRAAGAALPGSSDIDVAIRVTPQQFSEIVEQRFGTPNPGSSYEKTMLHAMATGKIQRGELGLSRLGRQLSTDTGIEKVDISVIEIGGRFDNGPWIPLR